MDKQAKLEKIYEIIADKTLSLGCIIWMYYGREPVNHTSIFVPWTYPDWSIVDYKDFAKPTEQTKIIWHPVMLWDVLDRIESKLEDNYFLNFYTEDLIMDICNKRKYKRKPIEEQDENCISFVYSLIKDLCQN